MRSYLCTAVFGTGIAATCTGSPKHAGRSGSRRSDATVRLTLEPWRLCARPDGVSAWCGNAQSRVGRGYRRKQYSNGVGHGYAAPDLFWKSGEIAEREFTMLT